MLEPVVEWLEEQKGISRLTGTLIGGISIWALGITTVLSFNEWSDLHPLSFLPVFEGKTFFGYLRLPDRQHHDATGWPADCRLRWLVHEA